METKISFKKFIRMISAFAILIFWNSQLHAQITHETTYPGASLGLYMVNLEVSGMKYVHKSEVQGNRFLRFYNLNHTLWKTINCNPFTEALDSTTTTWIPNFDALYISENLFDCDNAIEFLYCTGYYNWAQWFTAVYKENGTTLLSVPQAAPLVRLNVPQQWRPIYNTPNGTKMILSYMNDSAAVFDLPCTLSTGIDQFSVEADQASALKVFPNPSFYESTIQYKLPDGIDEAEIIITDSKGSELKRYTVDNSFSNVLISQEEFQAGTYFYSLVAEGKILETKKIILMK